MQAENSKTNKHMHRRLMVKQLVLATGAYLLLPACKENKNRSSAALHNMQVNGDQEALLAELAETILPKTDTPGAKDINAHLFTLVMIDDCMKKEDQQKFMSGLKDFEKAAKTELDKSFGESSPEQRRAFVAALDSVKKDDSSDLHFFYSNVKRFTVQAYTTSQYFLTKVQVYELVPGRYHGCIPIKPSPQIPL